MEITNGEDIKENIRIWSGHSKSGAPEWASEGRMNSLIQHAEFGMWVLF